MFESQLKVYPKPKLTTEWSRSLRPLDGQDGLVLIISKVWNWRVVNEAMGRRDSEGRIPGSGRGSGVPLNIVGYSAAG